jgi:hypothetical protein
MNGDLGSEVWKSEFSVKACSWLFESTSHHTLVDADYDLYPITALLPTLIEIANRPTRVCLRPARSPPLAIFGIAKSFVQ